MSDENIEVSFDPEVEVTGENEKNWFIKSGDTETNLPKKHVLGLAVGEKWDGISMPKWLAIDRGFVPDDGDDAPHVEETQATLPITRYDLIQAVALHALLIESDCGNYCESVLESAKIAHLATKDDR